MTWIYKTNEDNTARFALGEHGENPLVCFGINPSTATPQDLDATIRRVKRFAIDNGFDGWIMLNIYPQRATDPKDIHNSIDEKLHQENLRQIEEVIRLYKPKLWAAWGTLIESRGYFADNLREIDAIVRKYDCEWITLGQVTKKGHPRHPLYLKADSILSPYSLPKL